MSSLRRFFCENILEDGTVVLSDQEKRHLFTSLRHRSGDKLLVLDGRGTVALAEIRGKNIVVVSKEKHEAPKPAIHLFFCPPHNKQKTDIILAQATELGIATITPIVAQNSVSRPDATPQRWKIHLIEAIKQSFNPFLPAICPIMTLWEAIKYTREANYLSYFGSLKQDSKISLPNANFANFAWFVGPEGGFTEAEEKIMLENAFRPLRISPYVLRIETACCAGITLLRSVAA